MQRKQDSASSYSVPPVKRVRYDPNLARANKVNMFFKIIADNNEAILKINEHSLSLLQELNDLKAATEPTIHDLIMNCDAVLPGVLSTAIEAKKNATITRDMLTQKERKNVPLQHAKHLKFSSSTTTALIPEMAPAINIVPEVPADADDFLGTVGVSGIFNMSDINIESFEFPLIENSKKTPGPTL